MTKRINDPAEFEALLDANDGTEGELRGLYCTYLAAISDAEDELTALTASACEAMNITPKVLKAGVLAWRGKCIIRDRIIG